MSAFLIDAENISIAWLKAVKLLTAQGGECFNLMVHIQNPLQVDQRIDMAYQQLLSDHNLLTLKQVTYTVFPRSVYLKAGQNAQKLYDEYNQNKGIFDRLRLRYPHKLGWGSYFRRMTHYPTIANGKVIYKNQLQEIIDMIKTRPRIYKSAYTIPIQVQNEDCRKIMGAPCLNYIALQLESDRTLNSLAVYRNHDFIQRAYGNYLSLGYLMKFLCDQTGFKQGHLSCLSSHATINNIAGAKTWPTTRKLRQILQDFVSYDQ